MSIMKDEIMEQSYILKNTYRYNLEQVKNIVDIIKKSNLTHIEIIARGSSRNACVPFKYILESNTIYRVSFSYPSTVTKYHGTLNKDTIYIAVSQGGKGEDVRLLIEEANKVGAITIAITNDENTPLNQVSKYNLYLKVNKEKAMAATKSFTSEVLLLDMLSYELSGINYSELENIGTLFNSINEESLKNVASILSTKKTLYVISRGETYGIAQEACCKLQETCFINAFPFASSDFMHGPLALVDSSFLALMLIPNDEVKEDVINLNNLILEKNGKTVLLDSSINNKVLDKYEIIFKMQLMVSSLTEILGTNPDLSRNLNKYTKTI